MSGSGGPLLNNVNLTLLVHDVAITPSNKIRIVLGDTVKFTASFLDSEGAAIDPDIATIDFRQDSDSENVPLLQESGNNWSHTFDSSTWCNGLLYWSLKVESGTIKIAKDGYINITSNAANWN